MNGVRTLFWKRIDVEGLERLELAVAADSVRARSSVICLDEGGFRLEYDWLLGPEWITRSVSVERWNDAGSSRLVLERAGGGWRVDGRHRPDLDGAEEPDLSVTPFCNALPIRRTPEAPGASRTLDTAYIDGAAMTVARSRQRYERQGPGRLRYVELGLSRGFEADLVADPEGLVLTYEHLFARVAVA